MASLDLISKGKCVLQPRAPGVTVVASALALAGMLTGCAGFIEANERFNDGWRSGRVLQIAKASDIRVHLAKDCRAAPGNPASAEFVLIKYTKTPSNYGYRVAPSPQRSTLAVGDRVELNIKDCSAPIERIQGTSADRS